uniref:Uncharacterized protein n=1 Tax=Sphaerodactylus townsendi TaxID=933632 RepID=A0ACB8FII4_9SAUR
MSTTINTTVELSPFAYSNAVYSSTGKSPFHIVSGQEAKPLPLLEQRVEEPGDLQRWVTNLQGSWEAIQKALQKAEGEYKQQADKKRQRAVCIPLHQKPTWTPGVLQTRAQVHWPIHGIEGHKLCGSRVRTGFLKLGILLLSNKHY